MLARRWVAYCVDPGCRCLDRAGVIIASPDEAPRGYECREEGETMTRDEVEARLNAIANRKLGRNYIYGGMGDLDPR